MRQQETIIPSLYDKAISNIKLAISTAFTLDKLSMFTKD